MFDVGCLIQARIATGRDHRSGTRRQRREPCGPAEHNPVRPCFIKESLAAAEFYLLAFSRINAGTCGKKLLGTRCI